MIGGGGDISWKAQINIGEYLWPVNIDAAINLGGKALSIYAAMLSVSYLVSEYHCWVR